MKVQLHSTLFPEVYIVEVKCFYDERGFFMESYHQQAFMEAGIRDLFVQDNHSRSVKGVLRGIHYQDQNAPMGKLIRCTSGRIWDVVVDLRWGSPTFGRWYAHELTEDNKLQLWCPAGFGHAFLTLSDTADVQYKCTHFYTPSAEGSIRWNDPDIGIQWPMQNVILSTKDQNAPLLADYLRNPAFTLR